MSKTLWIFLLALIAFDLTPQARAEAPHSEHISSKSAAISKATEDPLLTDHSKLTLKDRPLPARYNECAFCHTSKQREFIKKGLAHKREHQDISPIHGKRQMSCNSCHDINNHNFLIKTAHFPADFKNPSPVCARCHLERFRDWKRGLHGKRTGGWREPEFQYHCLDCHHAHVVKFPEMEALPPPYQSPLVIPKHDEHPEPGPEGH